MSRPLKYLPLRSCSQSLKSPVDFALYIRLFFCFVSVNLVSRPHRQYIGGIIKSANVSVVKELSLVLSFFIGF